MEPGGELGCTIWLFNSSPWKDPPFLIGKPSFSMGHLYHGYVSHNQRVALILVKMIIEMMF